MLSGKSPADHLPSADWEQLEAIVAHFEEAWQSGSQPRLADYLPSEDDQCLAVLVELIHSDMEFRLKAGTPTR